MKSAQEKWIDKTIKWQRKCWNDSAHANWDDWRRLSFTYHRQCTGVSMIRTTIRKFTKTSSSVARSNVFFSTNLSYLDLDEKVELQWKGIVNICLLAILIQQHNIVVKSSFLEIFSVLLFISGLAINRGVDHHSFNRARLLLFHGEIRVNGIGRRTPLRHLRVETSECNKISHRRYHTHHAFTPDRKKRSRGSIDQTIVE